MSESFPFLSEYRGKKSRRAEKERKAPVWHSGPLCGSNGAREHPCPSHWRQAGFGPLFPAVLERWFPSRPPFGGRNKHQEKQNYRIFPQYGTPLWDVASSWLGAILPTHGWGKQSVWLAASGSQRSFRAEARTHFAAKGRKQREKSSSAGCQDCDAVNKEKLPWAKRGEDKHNHNPCLAV